MRAVYAWHARGMRVVYTRCARGVRGVFARRERGARVLCARSGCGMRVVRLRYARGARQGNPSIGMMTPGVLPQSTSKSELPVQAPCLFSKIEVFR